MGRVMDAAKDGRHRPIPSRIEAGIENQMLNTWLDPAYHSVVYSGSATRCRRVTHRSRRPCRDELAPRCGTYGRNPPYITYEGGEATLTRAIQQLGALLGPKAGPQELGKQRPGRARDLQGDRSALPAERREISDDRSGELLVDRADGTDPLVRPAMAVAGQRSPCTAVHTGRLRLAGTHIAWSIGRA